LKLRVQLVIHKSNTKMQVSYTVDFFKTNKIKLKNVNSKKNKNNIKK